MDKYQALKFLQYGDFFDHKRKGGHIIVNDIGTEA